MAGTAKATIMVALGTLFGFEGSNLARERSLAPSNRPWISVAFMDPVRNGRPLSCLLATWPALPAEPSVSCPFQLIVSIFGLIDGQLGRLTVAIFCFFLSATGCFSLRRRDDEREKIGIRIFQAARWSRIMAPINYMVSTGEIIIHRKRRPF